MSNDKQTTALQQLKKYLQNDVDLKFLSQKDVDRINWYIDTYFLSIERQHIEDAYNKGINNGLNIDYNTPDSEDYFESTFTQ
jgi:hypothetical protein